LTEVNARKRATQELTILVDEIETKIGSGEWPPGTRLPTERELEQRLRVSRNTLRKALRRLEAGGKIRRHVGRGTFVAEAVRSGRTPSVKEPPTASSASRISLLDILRSAGPADLMEIRLVIEPAVAELAAHRASARQLEHLQTCFERMEAAQDIPDYEHWDAQFHETIVSSAKNEALGLLYAAITEARNSDVWAEMKKRSVTPERRAGYQAQHRAILDALLARDAERARAQVQHHLREVRNHLLAA